MKSEDVGKISESTPISADLIDLSEKYRLRECDDQKTIDDYEQTYRNSMSEGSLVDNPFPPCGGYFKEDGKFVPTAGRHRIIAGINVGLKKFQCIIFPDEKSAVWFGLGDNRKNGLRNQPGDLKKMIEIALTKYDRSHRTIAIYLGCSPSYVDLIAKQLPSTGQLPEKRTGRDGKDRLVSRRRKTAVSSPCKEVPKESKTEKAEELAEQPEPVELTTQNDSNNEAETIETSSTREAENSAQTSTETPQASSASVTLITVNDFLDRFKENLGLLTASDQEKIDLFPQLICILYRDIQDEQCRQKLLKWNKEEIKRQIKSIQVNGHGLLENETSMNMEHAKMADSVKKIGNNEIDPKNELVKFPLFREY